MINNTICFVAGKSGGHIIPCLTLAKNYAAVNKNQKIIFFSADTPLDRQIISNSKDVTWHIPLSLSSIQRQSLIDFIKIFWRLIHSFFVSFYYLLKYKPSRIITTGGVVAIPACYAAFLLRIPITVYCLDAVPGKAIKAIAPLSTTVNVCFARAQQFFKKSMLVPYPIKYSHDTISIPIDPYASLGLNKNKKTVVILGGSQGSLFLNESIKKWFLDSSFSSESIQIIHQTGSLDDANWNEFYKTHKITAYVFSYQTDLFLVYTIADIILCRAGAGTLFEILFFNKKCIVVPLETNTTTHQVDNAQAISQEYPHLFYVMYQQDIKNNKSLFFDHLQNNDQNVFMAP